MSVCLLPPQTGTAVLTAPLSYVGLQPLPLTCEQGWSLEQLQIGFPAVRSVVRNRAIDDGVFDDTLFVGARSVTLTLRMATPTATQAALDRLLPFVSPRERPVLTWSLAGSPTETRSLTLRGVDAPVVIDGPSYQSIVVSFVSTESYVRSGDQRCILAVVQPSEGRTYDLTFDRVYSAASYTINGRTMTYRTVAELRAAINAAERDVLNEETAQRAAAGLGGRTRFVIRM